MRVKLDFGTELDILTQGELDQSLSKAAEIWDQRARGIRYIRRTAQPQAASYLFPGPRQGFAWDLKLIGAQFAAADNLLVYLGESALFPLWGGEPHNAGSTSVVDVATWSAHQVVLNPGESLTVKSFGGAVMTELIAAAIEIPAERLGVILS